MILLRRLLGDVLRRQRQRQSRTLREVSAAARVSLGYLSEVERGQKEASSELLAAICSALGVRMSEVLREVSEDLALAELSPELSGELAPQLSGADTMRAVFEQVGVAGGKEMPENVSGSASVRDVVVAA